MSYAGDAPGLVSGALQFNVQAPASASTGNTVPLPLKIGGIAGPVVNMAVK